MKNQIIEKGIIDDKVAFNTIILPSIIYLFFGKIIAISVILFFASCYTIFSQWIFQEDKELRKYKMESFILVVFYFYSILAIILFL